VAVTSLLLGNGLGDTIDGPIQANPNSPMNQKAQDEYNHSAVQVPPPPPTGGFVLDLIRFDLDLVLIVRICMCNTGFKSCVPKCEHQGSQLSASPAGMYPPPSIHGCLKYNTGR